MDFREKRENLTKRPVPARTDAEAARAEAEAAHARLSFLSDASRILGSSLDYETTLRNLARLTVPTLADFCAVDLVEDDGRIRRVALADIDAKREELVSSITRRYPLTVDTSPSYAAVITTGESRWLPEVTDEVCLALPGDADLNVTRSLNFRSFICVPLPVHGKILGSISLACTTPGRSYGSLDLALAEELARRAALAVDHARLYRESQQANRVKDDFLATLSHELRSPLSSALLCAQMLRQGILDEEKSKRALETIERKISLEVRLVDDLVDIAGITSGKVSLTLERVDLASVVQHAVESARAGAEAKGIQLSARASDVEVPVRGDEVRLQQVIGNLISNAIKFTPTGSIEVVLEPVGAQTRITVSDTGIGISTEALLKIFDRFHQADTTLTRKYGGLGLGLAIVRNLVDLHGGTVTAQSPGEGHGATFTVLLPLLPPTPYSQPRAPSEKRNPLARANDLHGLRVLLVDDDDDARESIATLLATRAATVITAASATQALDALQRGDPPDVLVMDIGMPDMDGYALLAEIRARGPGGERFVPAIAATAYASAADRQRALAAGFQLHLPKPVNQDALVAAVAELAGRRGPPPDNTSSPR